MRIHTFVDCQGLSVKIGVWMAKMLGIPFTVYIYNYIYIHWSDDNAQYRMSTFGKFLGRFTSTPWQV